GSDTLRARRRYAVLVVFIIAAVLTPPDVISQCSLAIPLVVLYELSIVAVRMIEKKRAQREAAEEEEVDAPPQAKPATAAAGAVAADFEDTDFNMGRD
ncbi:MAG: twin-arginine translocase subunit TatC, partial [Alphaproteobacteria bacterium]